MVCEPTRVIDPLEIVSAVCRNDHGSPDCLVPKDLQPHGKLSRATLQTSPNGLMLRHGCGSTVFTSANARFNRGFSLKRVKRLACRRQRREAEKGKRSRFRNDQNTSL